MTYSQQSDVAKIESVRVKDQIFVLTFHGAGNIGLYIGEDGTFLIDDQLAIAEKPLVDLEEKWGKGWFSGDQLIGMIYAGF